MANAAADPGAMAFAQVLATLELAACVDRVADVLDERPPASAGEE